VKRRSFSLAAGLAVAAASLSLAACTETTGEDGAAGGVLRIAGYGEDDVNFSVGWNAQNPELSLMAKALYDSLFISDGGLALAPGLATKWSYDEARTTLTVDLRDDVTFSDGSTLDAQDVKSTLDWWVDFDANYASVYGGADVVDDRTLVINLKKPNGYFLTGLLSIAITSSEAIADPESMVTDPIGTGPYVLNRDDSIEASRYVFDKREEAWEADNYPFEQLVFQMVGVEPSAAVNALRSGQVDFVPSTDGSTADSVVAEGYQAIPYPQLYFYIAFDTTGATVPELADLRVRQAINYAIDRVGIAENVNYGYGNPSAQVDVNPDGPMYRPERGGDYAYSVDEAKSLLAEAGYPEGFDMDMVAFEGVFDAYEPVIRQAFADIGINLDFVEASVDTAVEEYASARYSSLLVGSDTSSVSSDYALGSIINPWPGNTTPELSALLDTLNTGDDEERAQAYAELGDFMLDEAWIAVLAHPGVVQLADPEVVAFRDGYKSWLGMIPLRAIVPAP
jgi:peptide/nickel transport system substrate-binding protein